MKTLLAIFVLLLASVAVHAQGLRYELQCPTGTSVIPSVGQTIDNSTGAYKQWLCVDFLGNVTVQGATVSLPLAVAQGQVLASTGPGSTYVPQTKPIIDIRDKGADCTGATNSDSALAFLATTDSISRSQLLLPSNCTIHVQNTILVKNQASFTITGAPRSGAAGKGTTIQCVAGGTCTAGPIIDMEFVNGFEISNLNLDANGLAAVSLNIDKTGTGGVYNTTDGIVDGMTLNVNSSGGGTQTWTGVSLSAVSTSNVEDMRVQNSSFYCNARPNNYTQYGVFVGTSQNAKNEVVRHNNFTNCFYSIYQKQGSMIVEENEFTNSGGAAVTGTGADIRVDGNSDVDIIHGNLDENGTQFFNCNNDANSSACNTSFSITIDGNHFAPAGTENTSVYWINTSNSPTPMQITNNGWDSDSMSKVIGSANNIVRPLTIFGNVYPNQTFSQFWTNGVAQGAASSADVGTYGLMIGNRVLSGYMVGQEMQSPFVAWRAYLTSTTFDDFAVQNATGTFLMKHTQGVATPYAFVDAPFSGITTSAVINPSVAPNINIVGTPGGATYTYAFVPLVGSVSCVGGTHTVASPTVTTNTGNATLSTSNFNQLQWSPIHGASEYAVYRTAVAGGTPSSTGLIGCVSGILNIGQNYVTGAAYATNQPIVIDKYQLNDTGFAGDSTTAPVTNTTGQITSTVATGQAPLTITSTTPVANLAAGPTTYNHTGTQQTGVHVVIDRCTLGTNCAVTLTGSAVFTSLTSYNCTGNDETGSQAVNFVATSGSAFTLNGTGTDNIAYICVGN